MDRKERAADRGILIVDDEAGIRESLAAYIRRSGFPNVDVASNGEEALEKLARGRFFLVVSDISMPGMGGIDLLAHVRAHHPEVDFAMITGHVELDFAIQALKNGAFDFFKKPFRFEEVVNTIQRVAEKQYLQRRSIELEVLKERRAKEEEHLTEFMLALAQIIDMKSPYTRQHSDRTSRIAALMAERAGLSDAEVRRVALGARLHDIGKLAVPEAILDKPGPLTPQEFGIMKEHPARGYDLCCHISCLKPVVSMIRWHHENLDGTGYPDGLAGDRVPTDARIVRIADYWDAITSNRSYRSPMEQLAAIGVMEQECASGRLDESLTRILFDLARSGALSHDALLAADAPLRV